MNASDLPLTYNAAALLDDNLPHRGAKTALYSDHRTLTFQQIADEANQVGHALRDLDVRFGERVGILAPDCAEWVTSFFGTIKIGAVAICLNTLLQSAEYEYIFHDSRPRVLIVHESLLKKVAPAIHLCPHVIVIGKSAEYPTFTAWIAPHPTELTAAGTHRDDFCSLHYSSGTTGRPKGMFHAHKDYPLISHNTGYDLLGMREEDRTFSAAKLFFVYGLGGNLAMPFYVGASIILSVASPRMASAVLTTIDRYKPTIFYSVPTSYTAILAIPDMARRYDLSTVRLFISAGEALPPILFQRWQTATGNPVLDTIGCTETFHTFLANRPDEYRPDSSGKPSPGYAVRIVDEAGNEVPQGEIGNLMVKGESVAQFYLHRYQQSRHTFRGEWLRTGDKYRQDADGFYWHAGRADDMLKVGGLWVSPVEVENVLRSHAAVFECAIVGIPDQNQMVKPHAFVHLNADISPTDDLVRDLLRHCRRELVVYKCPQHIKFVDELPKTATGKIQRYKLRMQG